jgi:hypothetical protein
LSPLPLSQALLSYDASSLGNVSLVWEEVG